jgi:Zn-dependent peptidase ImmA (M78 family)
VILLSKALSLLEKQELDLFVIPIAKEVRKSFIDENKPINDTFFYIEQLGFFLVRFPALDNTEDLSGFYIEKEHNKCIYVNSRQNLGRQYLSVWHEFYHAYTGEGKGLSYITATKKDPIEYKADSFAGCILMPDNLVKQYINKNKINLEYLSYIDIIKMQNYFHVGYSAMLTRLIQLFPDSNEKFKKPICHSG